MKKEMTLQNEMMAASSVGREIKKVVLRVRHSFMNNRLLNKISALYSLLLEQHLSNTDTLHILHVQIASACLLFPMDISLVLRFAFLIWTAIALYNCRYLHVSDE